MKLKMYLEKVFGQRAIINEYDSTRFPFYLQEEYRFCELLLNNLRSILMIAEDTNNNFKAIKQHYQKACDLTQENCVIVFDSLTTYRRNKLIEENIPFIECEQQIYLPFIGISLNEHIKKEKQVPETLSPTTQAVILFLYYKEWGDYNATELAMQTNLTKMTASRAIRDIVLLGLVKEIGENTRKHIIPALQKEDFLKKAAQYLKSPVQKVIYIKKMKAGSNVYAAGFNALSHKTMLAANEDEGCYAIDKKWLSNIPKEYIVNEAYKEVYGAIRIELWKYDPGLLAENMVVDDISLVLSFDKSYDERTEKMIEEIKRKHKW